MFETYEDREKWRTTLKTEMGDSKCLLLPAAQALALLDFIDTHERCLRRILGYIDTEFTKGLSRFYYGNYIPSKEDIELAIEQVSTLIEKNKANSKSLNEAKWLAEKLVDNGILKNKNMIFVSDGQCTADANRKGQIGLWLDAARDAIIKGD